MTGTGPHYDPYYCRVHPVNWLVSLDFKDRTNPKLGKKVVSFQDRISFLRFIPRIYNCFIFTVSD